MALQEQSATNAEANLTFYSRIPMTTIPQEKVAESLKSGLFSSYLTIDVESDWGGRTNTLQGIEEGIPFILDELKKRSLKAVFFLSTQYLDQYLLLAKRIQEEGHTLGSHGHLHRSWRFKKWYEWRIDRMKSMRELKEKLGILGEKIPYRAPKFSYKQDYQRYSDPKGHLSLLKSLWLRKPLTKETIFYMHPFDIVKPNTKIFRSERASKPIEESLAPNLFCRFWYSRWKEAREHFIECLETYSSAEPLA